MIDVLTISPDLSELARMSDAELAEVKNFVVGRRGYGRVKFVGATDVRGVRINDIFVFRHRALLVYPDDEKKPPVGKGFNRPAIVTLERVFPCERLLLCAFLFCCSYPIFQCAKTPRSVSQSLT